MKVTFRNLNVFVVLYGPTGGRGERGIDEDVGDPDVEGVPGRPGAQGLRGVQGTRGLEGAHGASCLDGLHGDQGPTGQTVSLTNYIAQWYSQYCSMV